MYRQFLQNDVMLSVASRTLLYLLCLAEFIPMDDPDGGNANTASCHKLNSDFELCVSWSLSISYKQYEKGPMVGTPVSITSGDDYAK